ncbi:hypothetical protein HN51_021138 [Arachis hypogaea]|uniref:Uncharacterized protein n=1 Tax=Arachis hypogaea TaxID=3818 RepID=A0A445EHS5_ARAHY|nr:rho GTPase-activating protein gacK-like [Arachis hypogaea]QHO52141.1 uncharacterized protein DS421_2g37000 [Arachis hypogaea]RYR74997.1 hypothetical protein Ahy_A02g009709 [Arachis hypogaea]
MANPPPVRPWSRLASLGPTPSKPSPQTQPSQQQTPTSRFKFILGAAGRTSSAPSSPEHKVPSPPNSTSMRNSLIPKPSQSPKNSTTENNAYANSTESPQGTTPSVQSYLKVNTEVQPTKTALQSEPKTSMLVQRESSEKQRETAKAKEKGIFHNNKLSDSENNGSIRVITISGENRGAYMEIIQSSSKKKPNFLHHKKGNSESSENYSADGKNMNKNNQSERTTKYCSNSSRMSSAFYINSNVQCVNNSLLYESSCTCNDPGVQLTLSARKPHSEAFHQTEHVHGKNKNN